MRFLTKIISVLLVFFILTSLLPLTHASENVSWLSETERTALIDSLRILDSQKAAWGLQNVDFTELQVGPPVQTYNCINNQLELSTQLFPITADGQLILWAVKEGSGFIFTTGLTNEINTTITESTQFALIYDAVGAYIYTNELVCIHTYEKEMEDRSDLTPGILSESHIQKVALSSSIPIGYTTLARAFPMSAYCNITRVPQTGQNTCWAATTACIYNYLNNLTGAAAWDDKDVVEAVLGDDTLDQGYVYTNLRAMLENHFNIEYADSSGASYTDVETADICQSISDGYPVFGRFLLGGITSNSPEHACTLFSYSIRDAYISAADPADGIHLLSYNDATGIFSYYSSAKNATLYLVQILFHR